MRDGGYGSNRFVCTSVILNSNEATREAAKQAFAKNWERKA
jgi:hypothetical protein